MPRLPARAYYAVIAAGVVGGAAVAGGAGWVFVARGGEADGRRVLADVANELVVPLAAMMGATFGGLAGVAAAVALDRR